MKKTKITTLNYFFFSFLFLELIYRIATIKPFFSFGLVWTIIFGLPLILFFNLIVHLFSEKINKIISMSLMVFLSILYIGQFVFISLFSVPFSFRSIGWADQAIDFVDIIIDNLLKNFVVVTFLLIPLILFFFVARKISFKPFSNKKRIVLGILIILMHSASLILLLPTKNKLYSAYKIYNEIDAPNQLVEKFGILTATRIDLKRTLFGFNEKISISSPSKDEIDYLSITTEVQIVLEIQNQNKVLDAGCMNEECLSSLTSINFKNQTLKEAIQTIISSREQAEVSISLTSSKLLKKVQSFKLNNVKLNIIDENEKSIILDKVLNNDSLKKKSTIKYNKVDIDFEKLINETSDTTLKAMHDFFMKEEATKQNEWTGLYKDKNLVFIVAEAFNEIAIREDLTPTLYSLVNSSFVFKNFYTPVILSTIGGEMQALLSVIPHMETMNIWESGKVNFPYAIGNSFAKVGYEARAFHDWSYTYYGRNVSRPTIGFANYLACRNGLEKLMNCNPWPPSDVEMMEAISPLIIGTGQKQVSYILTVSGHAPQTWSGSYISAKNRELVKNLSLTENEKGYLAAQMELDKALEVLIKNLKDSGELDKTVIALVGDHYPYQMTMDEINDLSTYRRDKIVEVNHSSFILYNSTTPTTIINKVASQVDVLPTLLNLFGIEYDSRLLIGKDILSDTLGLACFSNRSWISDKGTYVNGVWTPKNTAEVVSSNYVKEMQQLVADKWTMSKLLIQKNYYEKVVGK